MNCPLHSHPSKRAVKLPYHIIPWFDANVLKTRDFPGFVVLHQGLHVCFIHCIEIITAPPVANLAHPAHSFIDVASALAWCNSAKFPSKFANLLDTISRALGEHLTDLSTNSGSQSRPISIRGHHDLQRAITMHTAKVKVTLWRHVGNVGGNFEFLAIFPYSC